MEQLAYLNPQDKQLSREIGTFDVPQRLVISGIYEFPMGPHQKWLNHGLASHVIGGWSVNWTMIAQSGIPISFPSGYYIYAVDGGDVCEAGEHFFIGLSGRTNPEGAAQLAEWLAQHGFGASVIDIRKLPGLLHLKTGLSWLGDRRLLATGGIAAHEGLRGWEIVRVPKGEDYAANCIRVNDALLIARGFPATSAVLGELGYALVPLDMSEYRKMDGGLSCLSLRW